jgi:hypothetical protein
MTDWIDRILDRRSRGDLEELSERLKVRLSRGRGRPSGAINKNGLSNESELGAQRARQYRHDYMKKHGLKRCPASVTEEALDDAKKIYPRAKKSVMRESIRKQSQYRVRLRR